MLFAGTARAVPVEKLWITLTVDRIVQGVPSLLTAGGIRGYDVERERRASGELTVQADVERFSRDQFAVIRSTLRLALPSPRSQRFFDAICTCAPPPSCQ